MNKGILILGLVLVIALAACNGKEDCIAFDYNNIEVKNVNGSWKIVEGSHWMMDFGNLEDEARQAFKIIRYYRMTEHCFVGRPDPSMDYWKVNGKSPVGTYKGEDCIGFNPKNIEVKQINNRWKIVEGDHWILDFESLESEARQAFSIIKKYGFTNICFVGRANPSMTYFRK